MTRKVTKAVREEIKRLRAEERLSAPQIAKRLGLCNHTAYKYTKKMVGPVDPTPKTGKRATWTKGEIDALTRLWPSADEDVIKAAIPNRPWTSIGRKASALDLRRPQPATRNNKNFVHPIFAQLRQAREQRRLTRPRLADKVGSHYNQILYWELGHAEPHFLSVVAWAGALGFDLVLRPRMSSVKSDLAPLTEAQKMGAR